MWKFQDFAAIQILREVKIGEFRSSKTAIFAILGALKFVNLVDFSLQKVQAIIRNQILKPLNMLKWQILYF